MSESDQGVEKQPRDNQEDGQSHRQHKHRETEDGVRGGGSRSKDTRWRTCENQSDIRQQAENGCQGDNPSGSPLFGAGRSLKVDL